MKSLLLITFLLVANSSLAQIEEISQNLLNTQLAFRTHKDSIHSLHEIIDGYVLLNGQNIYVADSLKLSNSVYYRNHSSTYLWYDKQFDNKRYATLQFIHDRLFMYEIYSEDPDILHRFYNEILKQVDDRRKTSYWIEKGGSSIESKTIPNFDERYSELNIHVRNKKYWLSFHYNKDEQNGFLRISDFKLVKRFPPWCGNTKNNNTWEKVERYLDRSTK